MRFISKISKGKILLLLLLGAISTTQGQLGVQIDDSKEPEIEELYKRSRDFFRSKEYINALNLAEQALQFTLSQDNRDQELKVLELMGDIYHGMKHSGNGIPYFVRASGICEPKGDTASLIRIYEKLALAYKAEKVHSKEQEYLSRLLQLSKNNEEQKKIAWMKQLGISAYHDGNYEKALGIFEDLLPHYPEAPDKRMIIHKDIVSCFDGLHQYDSALVHCNILLEYYEEKQDIPKIARLHNNIGYYNALNKDFRSAAAHYYLAVDKSSTEDQPGIYTNLGICNTNLGNVNEATEAFNKAIELLETKGDLAEKSRNENLLANLYLSSGDLYNAGHFSQMAIQSSRDAGSPEREADACLTYSKVLRAGNDPVNALSYYEKHLGIRDSIEFTNRMKLQDLENKKVQLERRERELLLQIKEEMVSEYAMEQLKLENDKIEQEKEILLQERNLEMYRQDSLRQSLKIKDQEFKVAEQEKANKLLEQEKELAESGKILADMRAREEERKANEAEQEKKRIERQAEQERKLDKARTRSLIGVIIGVVLLALLILVNLISSRNKNQLLAKQKAEIEEKNEVLEQKNEEITAQRDEIDEKKTVLEQQNEEITAQRDEIEAQRNLVFSQKQAIEQYNEEILKSIEYAKRLQSAALPSLLPLDELLNDHFVFFRPRDVVSGDFYWFATIEDKTVITVADCTGHGVPGAFMSMMGISSLKEIVQKEYITHPGVILRKLRKAIVNALGHSEQKDGMDMALITIDHKAKTIDYAGAYNSLYLARDVNNGMPEIEGLEIEACMSNDRFNLFEIPADKMPVAEYDRMDKFRNHEFKIIKGDTFYLFTDGFADQFGGERNKKFMYKPFKRLILENAHLSLEEQNKNLETVLDNWMGDNDQVDDICIMGIRPV